uniref:Uncharacterized protein n=1 Tax=Maylandia zebra TaxID=106582 RepID=A0A3P9CE93_9CICH
MFKNTLCILDQIAYSYSKCRDGQVTCDRSSCVATCHWSAWSSWSPCDVTCGLGLQQRYSPLHYFPSSCCAALPGGTWSKWTGWSECSKTCFNHVDDVGVRRRFRSCTPFNHTQPPCNTEHCPGMTHVDTQRQDRWHHSWKKRKMKAWSAWSQCSSRCDSGVQTRERLCNSPTPQHGGKSCSGPHIQTRDCNSQPCSGTSVPGCHVDGGWSQWGAWTECSLSCGGGVKFRRRLCDNPSPQSGGRGCLGDAEQQRDCNTHLCTVGPWLPWSQWSECSVSCGGGQQYRSRLCSLPACSGRQSKICNTHVCLGEWNCSLEHCAVHGALSSWGPWSPCSLSCGGLGLKTRSRGCTQPAPARGGRDCQGHGGKRPTARPLTVQVLWRDSVEHV